MKFKLIKKIKKNYWYEDWKDEFFYSKMHRWVWGCLLMLWILSRIFGTNVRSWIRYLFINPTKLSLRAVHLILKINISVLVFYTVYMKSWNYSGLNKIQFEMYYYSQNRQPKRDTLNYGRECRLSTNTDKTRFDEFC